MLDKINLGSVHIIDEHFKDFDGRTMRIYVTTHRDGHKSVTLTYVDSPHIPPLMDWDSKNGLVDWSKADVQP